MNLGNSNQEDKNDLVDENITDDIIWKEALVILNDRGDDVINLTSNDIRKLIENKLNIDLESKKKWLREKLKLWMEAYNKNKQDDEFEKENVDEEGGEDQGGDEEGPQDEDEEDDDEEEDDDNISINSEDTINDLVDAISIKEPIINDNNSQINLESIINTTNNVSSDDDLSSDEDDNEEYLQKLNSDNSKLLHFHQETLSSNYNEITNLTKITRDENGIIIDPLHKTLPFLTKYEYTRILGQRAKQIEQGAQPFIKIDENIIDPYLIAKKELENKKLPFIIKRPMPCSGFEYWHLEDLEILTG
jgi:DNA-directed RNA polymerase I, II, and III subunit RPABC2